MIEALNLQRKSENGSIFSLLKFVYKLICAFWEWKVILTIPPVLLWILKQKFEALSGVIIKNSRISSEKNGFERS